MGMLSRSDESSIGAGTGILNVGTVRRHGMTELQWDKDRFDKLTGAPWEPAPGREGI